MARPRLKLDEGLIERLAKIHCTDTEIAAALNCHVDTIRDRYSTLIAKGRENGKITLRRMQFEAAQKGNIVMTIWLGKQILGQREPQAIEMFANAGIKIVVEDFKSDRIKDSPSAEAKAISK